MNRRTFIAASTALAALLACRVHAQGATAPRHIGMHLYATPAAYNHLVEEFRMTLKSLGYVEGRDIVLDIRWADNRIERLPELAAELLSLKPAVIVTYTSEGVAACQKATTTVPIVFAAAGDAVRQGFIQSFRRPGGNITGVAFNEEINKKIYEVVKEVLPNASRIATLVNVKNQAQKHHLDDLPEMVKALRFQSILVHATQEEELDAAFRQAVQSRANAMVVSTLAPFTGLRSRIVELQNTYRMPTFHGLREAVQAGAIASYSFPFEENFRRAAAIVDKILSGQNPAEIPVELPTHYEIAVNLKAAKAIGLTIPPSLLARANQVIE
jgi:putative ABC transport system substrate-binding protein